MKGFKAMADLSGFDASQHEDMRIAEVLPEGKYLAIITASELKETKSRTGEGLNVTFQIIEGPYKGANLYSWLNMRNPSAKAVQIAQCELAMICKAVNVLRPKDSSELHDLPLALSVKQAVREDNGKLSNRIAGYYPKAWLRENPATNGNVDSNPAASQAAPAGSSPWKTGK